MPASSRFSAATPGTCERNAIRHMAAQEKEHFDRFDNLVRERGVRPTMLEPLWRVAGYALGATTALMGEKAAMACTVAVEEVIDEHYADQAERLGDSDTELKSLIEGARAEELEHREHALASGAEDAPAYPLLSAAHQVRLPHGDRPRGTAVNVNVPPPKTRPRHPPRQRQRRRTHRAAVRRRVCARPGVRLDGEDGRRALVRAGRVFQLGFEDAHDPPGETWMRPDGLAAAAWIPPGVKDSASFFIDQLRLTPLILNLTSVSRLSRAAALAGAMDDHPAEPHYYLAFIAVAPNKRGHGMGSALLEETLARVDRAGAPAYLENSNPRNLPLYQRLGFRTIKEVRARDGAPPLFAMWRPATGKRKTETQGQKPPPRRA